MKKFKLLMVATITSMLITSCGSDSDEGGGGSTWAPNGSYGNMNGGQISSEIIPQISCQGNGVGQRMRVINSHVQGFNGMNTTQIGGQLNSGLLAGGTESSQHAVGVNSQGDLLIITKVINGNSVIGYNFRFAFCSRYFSYQNQNFPLISNDRQISGITLDSPAIISTDTTCPAAVISSARVSVYSGPYNANGIYLQPTGPQQITFLPIACI